MVVQKGQEFHETACISDLVAKKTSDDNLLWYLNRQQRSSLVGLCPTCLNTSLVFYSRRKLQFLSGGENWIISAARRCCCRQIRLTLPPQPLGCVVGPFSRKQRLRVHVPERSQWKEGKKKTKQENHMFSGMFGFVVGERWEACSQRHEIRGGGGDGRNKFEDCLCLVRGSSGSNRWEETVCQEWMLVFSVFRRKLQVGVVHRKDIEPPRSILFELVFN